MARKNHYILRIEDHSNCAKRGYTPRKVLSRYFDGTEAQAARYFRQLEEVKRYRGRTGCLIYFQANPVVLVDSRQYRVDY